MEQKPQPKSKATFYILMAASTAILLAAPVIVLAALGFFLDKLFHTSPIILIAGGVIGFIGGTVNVYKLVKAMNSKK